MNLNIFWKPKKDKKTKNFTQNQEYDSDFLLPEDKIEIKKLTFEKSKHLKSVRELNHEISKIQTSTETLVPRFAKIHHDLRQKYQWYYNWHTKTYSHSIHWLVLLLYIISLPLVYFYLSPYASKTKATTYDFPRWEQTNPKPTYNTLLHSTICQQDNSIWTVGTYGTILKSTDNGANWQQQQTATYSFINKIACINQSNIIAVGNNGIILKYNGISWSQKSSGTSTYLMDIAVLDINHIIVVGFSGTISTSSDGGDTWTTTTVKAGDDSYRDLYKIIALDSQRAIAVGASGAILVTSNAGQSWQAKWANTNVDFYDITSLDTNHIIAVGTYGEIILSQNAGQNWNIQESNTENALTSIIALNSSRAVAVGAGGTITISSNQGQTWTIKDSGTSNDLRSAALIGSNNLAVVGSSGTITVSYDSGDNWSIETSGTTNTLYKTVATTSNYFVAIGDKGTILSSSDLGSTWNVKSSGTQNFLNSVIKLDVDHVFAIGDSGTIIASNDGGITWNQKISDTSNLLYDITSINSNKIVAVGYSGTITVSSDSGDTWNVKNSGTTYNLYSVTKVTNSIIIAVGASGTITVSVDGGNVWTTRSISGFTTTLNDVIALDENNIIAVGASGKITVSSDGGDNWAVETSGTSAALSKITMVDSQRAVVVGNSGTILATSDAGQSWSTKPSGINYTLTDLILIGSNRLISIGYSGTILSSTDGGNTWSTKPSGTTSEHFYSVAALNTSNLLIASAGGRIFGSSDGGETWGAHSSYTNTMLKKIIGFNSTDAIVVGYYGTVLRYHSPANATATKFLVKLPGQNEFTNGNPITDTPTSVQAGDTVTATIYAVDASNNLDVSNASWAGFTTTDPNDSTPATVQLTQNGTCVQTNRQPGDPECGIGTATFVFHTPGTWTVTASDVYSVLSSGTSSSITVTAGDPAKLAFSGLPSSLNLGSPSNALSVNIQDLYGNATSSASSKTIRLATTSTDGRFATSSTGPWTNDQLDITVAAGRSSANFYYLDFRTGTSTITASETPDAGWTNASGNITINTGTLTESTLALSSNTLTACSGSISATATLKNNEGLTLTDRTIQLQSSRNGETTYDSISPSSAITSANGTATFSVSSTTAGSFTLTGYDQTDNLYLPQSQNVSVTSGGISKINLSNNTGAVTAGSPFDLSTILYNVCDSVVSDYTGEVEFSSSDDLAEFTDKNHTFSSSEGGKHTQSVILKKEGQQSISASAEGVTGTIYVNVLAATTITSTTPTPSISPSIVITAAPTEEPKTLIETFQESPILQKIAKTLVPITATVATLGLIPLLIQGFPQGFHVLASLFPTIFTAAAARRRRKPWGIVYDSLTNKPVDLVVVRVFNANTDRLVVTKVTDQNGRFSFLLSKGKYYIKVTKTGFVFPPKLSKLKARQLSTRFGPQSDIYFGQGFVIGTDDTNINLNIAIDPKPSTLSSPMKLLMWFKNGFDWFLIGLSYFAVPLMLLGAAFAGIATVIIPSRFNLYMSGFYVVLLLAYLIVNKIKTVRLGFVFDAKSRKPIANATVSIFDKEYNAIREIKTTDLYGHFAILAQKGQYYLTAQAKDFKFPSKDFKFQKQDKKLGKLYFGETINNKKPAFIKVSIPLDKI